MKWFAKSPAPSGGPDPHEKEARENKKGGWRAKVFRAGGYSVLLTAIVLACAVLLNLLVSALPPEVIHLDTTSNELYSISQQTREIVGGLEEDVTLYFITQVGTEDTIAQATAELLDRYAAMNDHIQVVYRDPVLYPNFVSQYTQETIYMHSVIVESARRYRVIDYYDILRYDYNEEGAQYAAYDGEAQLTSAIDYVTSDDLPVVYTLTGHGEYTLPEAFSEALAGQNFELRELSLLQQETVPEDADALLFLSPQSDLSDEDYDKLAAYLEGGGRMFAATDYTPETLENVNRLMAAYGLENRSGVHYESDPNSDYHQPYVLLPALDSHAITDPLREGGYYVLAPVAHGMTASESHRDTLSITPLLTTTASAFSKQDINSQSLEKEEGDIDGPFTVAAAVSEPVGEEETRVVWVATSAFLQEGIDQIVAGGNTDFFLNAVGWITERENTISIHSKMLSVPYLTITAAESSMWITLLVVLLPILTLVMGGVIWYRRKNR